MLKHSLILLKTPKRPISNVLLRNLEVNIRKNVSANDPYLHWKNKTRFFSTSSANGEDDSEAGKVVRKVLEEQRTNENIAKNSGNIIDKTKTLLQGDQTKSENPDLIQNSRTLLKVVPRKREKTDFSKPHTDNIFITPSRALNEYSLDFRELTSLTKYTRRSPYPERDDITVYLRGEVEKKAIEKFGSFEALQQHRNRRKVMENIERNTFLSEADIRQAIEDYNKQHEDRTIDSDNSKISEEKPYIFKPQIKDPNLRASIFKIGPGKVILYAVAINGANCLMKLIAWLYTGSHSMFSEFIHSLADCLNQIILAVGLHQSLKQPDTHHPYGWSNFRNVSSLISGVGIFCLGAGLSWYHGILGLLNTQPIDSLFWAIAILGGSFVSEGATLLIAINQIRQSAKAQGIDFSTYVWQGYDPSTNVVLLEDAAAVLGVSLAASCMAITHMTGSHIADAAGSLLIGTLLSGVASFIIYTNSVALVGRSIPTEKKLQITEELEKDRMIRCLHDVKATSMGSSFVRFKAEVDFDGRELTRKYLESIDVEKLTEEVNELKSVEDVEQFLLKHGENIIDTMGSEVDRIEKKLKKKHPEVRHVDLETL
ncbi:DgyrCDS10938 [Dimorphilus gyrociliatus]|uniref:Proton-coupled zinc antiporter SLC30A9, mitochondrial n=1 Tax=Dimorphilus gyrociliatus TaxID=2664684 RepID=A0A7I8W1U8_9ANNE|nr:DgyrCDS10938 [Dimorphilus gyrociliatus]